MPREIVLNDRYIALKYDRDEADRAFRTLWLSVFRPCGDRPATHWPHKPMFDDPKRTGILMRDGVRFLDRHRKLLLSEEDEAKLADPEWGGDVAFIADPRNELEPLFAEVRARGQNTVLVIVGREWGLPEGHPWQSEDIRGPIYRIAACSQALTALIDVTNMTDDQCSMFDESGVWGFDSDWEDFSFIAGPADFIAAIADRQGGMAEVRRWTDLVWANWARVDKHISLDDISQSYRLVGWDNCPADDPAVLEERRRAEQDRTARQSVERPTPPPDDVGQ